MYMPSAYPSKYLIFRGFKKTEPPKEVNNHSLSLRLVIGQFSSLICKRTMQNWVIRFLPTGT